MTSPVVVDYRTDEEKLHELRALASEFAELDFKATLDLANNREALNFAKDCIAMLNTAVGGYILVGLNDDGRPAHDQPALDVKRFDSAALGQLVKKYIDVPAEIYSQKYLVDGRAVVLIVVFPSPNGLPAFIARIGQFEDGQGRMKTVLTPGVLYTRSGTQNVAASDGHWPKLLERYRAGVVEETRGGVDALIRTVVESLHAGGSGAGQSPLVLGMANDSFAEAVIQHLENKSDAGLRRFLRKAVSAAKYGAYSDYETRREGLDKIAIVAIEAMEFDNDGIFDESISALHKVYTSTGPIDEYSTTITALADVAVASHWLQVTLRLYLIGAAAVRGERWWAVSRLALRSVKIGSNDKFASWFRNTSVFANRARLTSSTGNESGLELSRARELGRNVPSLRPDIRQVGVLENTNTPDYTDPLLDSLAQFDLSWCVSVAASNPDLDPGYAFYPSCAALRQSRAQPAITAIAISSIVRRTLAPGASDAQMAEALYAVVTVARKESWRYGAHWPGIDYDPQVAAFIEANRDS